MTVVESFDRAHRSDHSTRFLATQLLGGDLLRAGDQVVEAGCGTGVLAAVAALRGAAVVWATDVVPEAVERARETAALSGVAPVVRPLLGPLLDPVPPSAAPDLVLAVLPQKPAQAVFSRRFAGGEDGADLLVALAGAAADRLRPGGRLVLFHHSIAHPARVEAALARGFRVRTLAERLRCTAAARYDSLAPGLLGHLLDLRDRGVARVDVRGPHLVWRARILACVRT